MRLLDFLKDEQARKDMAQNLRNLGQSASNTVAENVSAPVDALAWALRRGRVPVPSNPIGGSEWMRQLGLMADVPEGAPKLAGETLGLLAPVVGMAKAPEIAAALRKGGENLAKPATMNKQTGAALVDYRGSHTAPQKAKGNAPLHDLTQTYPEDIYSSRAAQYYGHYGQNDPADRLAISLMQSAKGKPDMPVTMYRAVPYQKTIDDQIKELDKQLANYMAKGKVPKDSYLSGSDWYENAQRVRENLLSKAANQSPEKLTINNGDWVTLSKAYAKEHGEGALGGNYKILSKKVPARKLFTDGNSIQEFGYDESGKAALEMLGLLGLGAGAAAYNSK